MKLDTEKLAERRLRAIREEYPLLAEELERLLPLLSREEGRCLAVLCAGLDCHDLLSLPVEGMLGYVRASLTARRELDYAAGLPDDLFDQYVLPPRVNNEYLDGSRGWLYGQLRERVRGQNMLSAALEVNCWCCEQATYTPADNRTIAPLGMCRRGKGRCGEESTLAVAALRAVCIPAQQVYVPRWAHCDDNHAWVEFWAAGQWHYMGACEPEPAADAGWFTSAASRAMLVRARVPDLNGGCLVVNTTARYADTAALTVRLTKGGVSMADVPVRFQLINESSLHTIYTVPTDNRGEAVLETGLGCLVVSAFFEGRLVEKLVDLREGREVTLAWEEGFDPEREERALSWELTPPKERVPAPTQADATHKARLARIERDRTAREAAYSQESDPWLRLARGNRGEIAAFLDMEEFSREDKEALLSTLREKDFADITWETLADALTAALPWKEKYQPLVWKNWVLAPRVENEMLLPVRCELMARLAGDGLKTGEDVLAWMAANLRPAEEYGLTDRRGDAAGYLRHGVCPRSEWDIVAVQLCRALGIPAFFSRENGRIMLVKEGRAYTPGLEGEAVRLRLRTAEGPVNYREHFTLARWTGEDYRLLELGPHEVRDCWDICLLPGAYRLTTSRRQIDGTVSARVHSFLLSEDRPLELTLEPDRTAEKLQKTPLPPVKEISLNGTGDTDLTAFPDAPSLLIFAQPGSEPTEHLLQELLELQEDFRAGDWPLSFLLESREGAENATLRQVLAALPRSRCFLAEESSRYAAQRAMGVGDSRLPLAVVLDRAGRGGFASANYHIRSAHTLLRILTMLS